MASSTSVQREPNALWRTFTAGEAITPFKFVKWAADGDVGMTDSANEAIRVAQTEAASGEPVSVCVFGPCLVTVGAATTFTGGGPYFVTADANAECIEATPGSVGLGTFLPDPKNGLGLADQDEILINFVPHNATSFRA